MARDDENKVLNTVRSPEDAEGNEVAVGYVFNPTKKRFYPDSKGLYSADPKKHRDNVTQVDTENPSVDAGIDCEGYRNCRFDVEVQGVNITTLKVQLLRWNSLAHKWFGCGNAVNLATAAEFTVSGGCVCLLEDEAFGATIFLKILEFVGSSFVANIYYVLC